MATMQERNLEHVPGSCIIGIYTFEGQNFRFQYFRFQLAKFQKNEFFVDFIYYYSFTLFFRFSLLKY